jgi:MinD-like ATPase involved in chromosome partitioning or flagellar assembly
MVDADLVAPSLAWRLGLSTTHVRASNVLTAVDAVEGGHGSLSACIAETSLGCGLVCGLDEPGAWEQVTADKVGRVVSELSARYAFTVVQTAAPIEQLPSGRHDVGRRMLQMADRVLVVTDASPIGLQRLTRWMWFANVLVDPMAVRVVCNHSNPETRAVIEREVLRTVPGSAIDHLPDDPRVRIAAGAREPVAAGPFARAVAATVDQWFPDVHPRRSRRLART